LKWFHKKENVNNYFVGTRILATGLKRMKQAYIS
jgi:hypothetical protein